MGWIYFGMFEFSSRFQSLVSVDLIQRPNQLSIIMENQGTRSWIGTFFCSFLFWLCARTILADDLSLSPKRQLFALGAGDCGEAAPAFLFSFEFLDFFLLLTFHFTTVFTCLVFRNSFFFCLVFVNRQLPCAVPSKVSPFHFPLVSLSLAQLTHCRIVNINSRFTSADPYRKSLLSPRSYLLRFKK